jgi:hypothetical protein
MSPDDEDPPGAAVAEPEDPKPLGEAPETPPPDEEPPPEGEVSGDQEGEPAEAEPTSEDARAEALGLILEDPALVAKLQEKLGAPEPDVAEERANWEAERGQSERRDVLSRAGNAALSFSRQNMAQAYGGWAKGLAEQVQKGGQDLVDQKSENADLLGDGQQLVAEIADYADQAGNARANYVGVSIGKAVLDAAESHPAHRHLSAEDKQRLKDARNKVLPQEQIAETVQVYLDAALRGAPEETKRKATQKTQQEAENIARLEKLVPLLGNGKRVTPAGSAPSKLTTLEAINEALMDPATPRDKLPELQQKRNQLLGR